MPIRVFVNSYGQYNARIIYAIICAGICIICPLWYTLTAHTAGGSPGRSLAVLAGGGGYAAAAGGGVTPKNSAKNKKPFYPML
nr:MAG TPA_asm: hypothetical protein [Caudoviricetes sp.]